MKSSLLLTLTLLFVACKPTDNAAVTDAAAPLTSAEQRVQAADQKQAELTKELHAVAAEVASAKADFAKTYVDGVADTKHVLETLEARGTAAKAKITSLPAAKKKTAEAAAAAYEQKRAAAAAALAKLPPTESDAKKGDEHIAALMGPYEALKDALDKLEEAVTP